MNQLSELPVPTEEQLRWQDYELGMFCHFGINTFCDQEWGDGKDSPALFHPRELDARQWVRTAKRAGFRYFILTAKHHDGFCLWPTATTDYSVASSPWKDGKGDVVKECADACREEGIGFGLYLSPWDRHEPCYADKKAYDHFYTRQLEELLTGYGPLVEIWFDGAGSEGREYDWPSIIGLVKRHQPGAMIFNMGAPTIRWVGNEDGLAPYPCWNTAESARVSMFSDASLDWLPETPRWVPAECDVPIRKDRWFWHPNEEELLLSLDELMDIYYRSVGHGATLLLNVAPDDRGLLPEADISRVVAFGDEIRRRFGAPVTGMSGEGDCLELPLAPGKAIDHVVLMEDIRHGERIHAYALEAYAGGEWKELTRGSAIGHKRIERTDGVIAERLRLRILESVDRPKLRCFAAYRNEVMSRLEWKEGHYLLDGEPFRIMSGAIHYFRVVPEYWRDRLLKLKACGFNTVETYVAWNVHEPKEGEFRFDGIADLESFIRLAGELGLHVIIRPSPYICAEWEFGGLPAWLLKYSDMRLRCSDPLFLEKVDRYYDELIPKLVPLLSTNGGPILAVQVENEYGSFGNDTNYLMYLRDGLLARGVDVLLFTSDGPTDEMLIGGAIDGVHATVNFGSRVEESFGKYREYRSNEPLMCMEYWNGWFDHWMEPHHIRDGEEVADVLDQMLANNASVNFYMFHGGTNFGFYSGANHIQTYEPTVTSYDYDAPLTEWGDVTPKYEAIRKVMAKHGFEAGCPLPAAIPKRSYGKVELTQKGSLFPQLDAMAESVESVWTLPMEKLGQSYGFILYSTWVRGPRKGQQLHIQDVRDRAQVFLSGKPLGIIERWNPKPIPIEVPAEGARLDILVENMGRINYGPLLRDAKGITEGVRIDNQFQYHWTITPLPLEEEMRALVTYEAASGSSEHTGPAFYKGTFEAEEIGDTFLRFDGWKKGVAWVNGFNLGRYWEAGPQRALYVPGPLLRRGHNEIVLFELEGASEDRCVAFTDIPDLGDTAAVDDAVLNFVSEDERDKEEQPV